MTIYAIEDQYDGRIYELFLHKETAERTLESIGKYDYYIHEYDVVES